MTLTRGDIWMAALDPVRGSEQAGTRPVLVLQAEPLNAFLRTVVIIPFTSNLRWAQYPFCAPVAAGDGGLINESVALCHQVRVIDKTRLVRRLGSISQTALLAVEQAIQTAIGL